jgi:hypothetical protein
MLDDVSADPREINLGAPPSTTQTITCQCEYQEFEYAIREVELLWGLQHGNVVRLLEVRGDARS